MTYKKLKKVDLTHFALHGYEGVSLSLIANEAGIKKPSIYTHFKSKEDLFICTFKDAVESEVLFVKKFISKNSTNPFFPPVHLKKIIKKESDKYVTEVEYIFKSHFYQQSEVLNSNINSTTATLAFLTLLYGLLVEQLYGESVRLDEKISESLHVF